METAKTKPTAISVDDYLNSVADESRRADCRRIVEIMQEVSGEPPVMWGPSIIGFGSDHYKYASGHSGETMRIGVSARKEHLVLYGVIFYDQHTELLANLGKHKQGKGCLYIKKLVDVDLDVLKRMIGEGFKNAPAIAEGD